MMWLSLWFNRNIATINVTLQILDIYAYRVELFVFVGI